MNRIPILVFSKRADEVNFTKEYGVETLTRIREYAAHVAPERFLSFALPKGQSEEADYVEGQKEKLVIFEREESVGEKLVRYYFNKII